MKGKKTHTQKIQGTILQNYYFLSLKLVWGKLLWKVIYCMLSWEPFSTGAFIINHTFPRTNHHALKKPLWGSQRLIYLLLCCGSKQSTKSTILQLYTCLAADSNMYSMYRSHVKAGFRHVGAPHRWFSVLCLSTGGPNEVSISKCESFCAETVWEHCGANILLLPIHETKKPETKQSMPHFSLASALEAGETRIQHNLYFFGMKRINRKRVTKLTVYYTCVNVFYIYLLLFVYSCVIFFKTSPVLGEGLI